MRIFVIAAVVVAALGDGAVSNLPRHERTYETSARNIIEFKTLDGKTADPCNRWTTTALPNCNSVPDSQTTLLLPSAGSESAISRQLQTQNPAQLSVTATGLFPGTTQMTFRLAQAQSCAAVDLTADATAALTDAAGVRITFGIPANWATVAMELEEMPRSLCASADGVNYFYTGFRVGVVWDCDALVAAQDCANLPTQGEYAGLLTLLEANKRQARTTCCKSAVGTTFNTGQCIFSTATNPGAAPQACCGGSAIELSMERCCSAELDLTAWNKQACPCTRANPSTCPSGETCCLPTKYPELSSVQDTQGECFDRTKHRCCDTGARYDPGAQQCCPINGLQTLNLPCPCNANTDCPAQQACCSQVNTTSPIEISQCNAYTNYPTGTGPFQVQRCFGNCFDTNYQICCNGVQCIKEYEKCCNQTCCNRFTQTCEKARRAAAPGAPSNWNDFYVHYEVCSTIEHMSPHKALWLFVYPAAWLLMTLLSTGLVLVFANKAASRSYAPIERALIIVAVLSILLALVLFFSVAYKYVMVILFVQLFNILTAAVRVRYLNLVTAVLNVLLILYLFDPFHGNQYLNFSSSRTTANMPDRETAGLIHILGKQYRNSWSVESEQFCSKFYLGFGQLDSNLRDLDRFDNPAIKTFAYCSRGYTALLLIFASLIMVLAIIQFLLSMLALLLRFAKPTVKLVVHEELEDMAFPVEPGFPGQTPLLTEGFEPAYPY